MVKIRLKRLGRKKRPFYRLIVTDIRARRDGAAVEELGYYDPLKREIKINKVSALAWIAKGAQATGTAAWLIQVAPDSGELTTLPAKVQKEKPAPAAPEKAAEKAPEPKAEAPKAEAEAPKAEAEAPKAEAEAPKAETAPEPVEA